MPESVSKKNGREESVARTQQESERSGSLDSAAQASEELAEWRKLQLHTKPAEKEKVASAPQIQQLARTPESPRQKEKEQNHQSKSQNITCYGFNLE